MFISLHIVCIVAVKAHSVVWHVLHIHDEYIFAVDYAVALLFLHFRGNVDEPMH